VLGACQACCLELGACSLLLAASFLFFFFARGAFGAPERMELVP